MEERYVQLISLLEKELDSIQGQGAEESLHPEIESLTYSVLGELKDAVDVADLERRLQPYKDVDLSKIKELILQFEGLQAKGSFQTLASPTGSTLDAAAQLGFLKEHISVIEEKGRELGETEVALRFELLLNTVVERILMCIPPENAALDRIDAMVKQQLQLLNDDNAMLLWGSVQKEFNPIFGDTGFLLNDEAKEFLTLQGVTEARTKLAYYLVRLRPRLTREAIDQQRTVWLQPILGIAKILTLRKQSELEPITHDEVNLLRAISKVVELCWQCCCKDKDPLLQFLGVMKDGFICKGEDKTLHPKRIQYEGKGREKHLLIQLAKILKYIDLVGKRMSVIERSLWAYKLGLEVTLPESRKPIAKQREEIVQRSLCKFLIERDIQAFGTKFGRNQIDLLLQKGGERYVIETKIYKGTVGGRRIRKDLVQLQTYMSQRFAAPKGMLIIYNLTDTVICPIKKWISGRYFILPVNLGQKSASRVEHSIEIDAVGGKELIRCSEVRAVRSKRKRVKRKN